MVGKSGKSTWRWIALGVASVTGVALLAWFALRGSELPEPDRDLRLTYEAHARKDLEEAMIGRGLSSYLARNVCAITPETYGPMEGRTQRHLREDPTLAAAVERGRQEAEQGWHEAQAANREAAFREMHCPSLLAVLQRHVND
jgi:hypothetical protein